ncbi:Oidioi.mRNA.OKI2018_I69.XSR.g13409.t1.cds [Oikopleura dioica]|uniref:Oidioi.mRNA.OKI2018_I69.XSR.g13409.t1.cds n=1 Tax=Oikopleura dioica TaxID=34765 RepID=A0ABN7SBZ1_OIKDI|nr:Oidioi.mRNA.OKI2018_I69.XSR.g13409.t1.cds [Oikopleura dioica]
MTFLCFLCTKTIVFGGEVTWAVHCVQCGLSFHPSCLSRAADFAKDIPKQIDFANEQLSEQNVKEDFVCAICHWFNNEELFLAPSQKKCPKKLSKVIRTWSHILFNWYDEAEWQASAADKEKVDVTKVISSHLIKQKLLQKFSGGVNSATGRANPTPLKLSLPNGDKDFPLISLADLQALVMDEKINCVRQFLFILLCWLLLIRASKDRNSIDYSLICFSDLMREVQEYMVCPDHHLNMDILAYDNQWISSPKDFKIPEQFLICAIPHKFAFLQTETDDRPCLVQVLGKKAIGQYRVFPLFDCDAESFPILDLSGYVEFVDHTDLLSISASQLRNFKPQLSSSMPKKEQDEYLEEFQKFLDELERRGYDLDDLVDFSPDEVVARVASVHTQTPVADFPEPEASLRDIEQKLKLLQVEEQGKAIVEKIEREDAETAKPPHCAICFFEKKVINQKSVELCLNPEEPAKALYFCFKLQWFLCEPHYQLGEEYVRKNTQKSNDSFKDGKELQKSCQLITELQKSFNFENKEES